MALKSEIVKAEKPAEAPLTVFGSADDIKKMLAGESSFLPEWKIVHPIEANEYIGKAVIKQSGEMEALKVPYTIGVIAVRFCARKLGDDKKYVRGYKGGKSNDTFVQLRDAAPTDSKVELGKSVLLGVWTAEDKCALAVAETYKTMTWYVQKPFASAIVADKAVVQIKIESHMSNMDASKDDPTRKYFAGKKFKRGTHWEQMEITAKQLESLELAYETARAAVLQWEAK